MSVQYCSFLSIKQILTNEQIEDILKINCNNWLKRTYDDFYGDIIESELQCNAFFAMSSLSFRSTDDRDLIHKYDRDGYWPVYFTISSDRISNINNVLISLVISKYIYEKWNIDIHCTSDINTFYIDFIYNEFGFIADTKFKKEIGNQHLHPISRNDLVFNYDKYEYEGINYSFQDMNSNNQITSYEIRNTNDIVIHLLKKGDGNVIKFSNCNGDPKYYLEKKPLNNPRLIEFECEGPAQRFIEYSNWQYQLTLSTITPHTTETYRAESIWFDVILIDIIKKAYYYEDEMIVSTATGEIILYMKNKQAIIDNKWQDYFSTFPVIPKDYKVEDITSI